MWDVCLIMKRVILAQAGFSSSLEYSLSLIKKAGFDGVFFTMQGALLSEYYINKAYEQNLFVEALHLPYSEDRKIINDLWANNSYAKDALKTLLSGIDLAYNNKIEKVILHASNGYAPPPMTREGINNFKIIAGYCYERGIMLTIENIKKMLYVERLLNDLSDYDIKFCFDIGHARAFTKNLYSKDWSNLFKKVGCVHIHDNYGNKDLHLIPGMGDIKYNRILKDLFKNESLNFTLELYYTGREELYKNITEFQFYKYAYDSIEKLLKEKNENT